MSVRIELCMNRPLRIRTVGGVGRRLEIAAYPISGSLAVDNAARCSPYEPLPTCPQPATTIIKKTSEKTQSRSEGRYEELIPRQKFSFLFLKLFFCY